MRTIKLSVFALILSTTVFTSCKKKGCMDQEAVNFDEKAKKDDNSCNFAPVITIVGANPATVNVGAQYNDAGATAFVKNTGAVDVTTDLSAVNTSQTGSFEVVYSASNTHGTTTKSRVVNVVLGQSSYLGNYTVAHECGGGFPHRSSAQLLAGDGPNQLKVQNAFSVLGLNFGEIVFNISGENVTVAGTTVNRPLGSGTLSFSGTGTMNAAGTVLTMNYDFSNTGLNTESGACTVVYTK